jgi:F0F1-type ATP synthase membrane subunit b/b'
VHPDLEAARQAGHHVVDSTVDKAEQWKQNAKETASDLKDRVEHYGQEFQHTKDRVQGRAKDTAKGAIHEAGEKVQEGTANAYNKMRNMKDEAGEKIQEGTADAYNKVKNVKDEAGEKIQEGAATAYNKMKNVKDEAGEKNPRGCCYCLQ